MPIYEYACSECSNHIEAFQKISDEPLTVCPECGGELSKLISSTSFVLKGGGWYADGYASSAEGKTDLDKGNGSSKPDKKKAKDAGKKAASSAGNSKPATKTADAKG